MENNSIPLIFYEKLVKKFRLFRIILILSLLPLILFFCSYFFVIISLETWLIALLVLFALYCVLYSGFSKSIFKEIERIYNWSNKKIKIPWGFKQNLENFNIFGSRKQVSLYFNLSGNFYNRDFNLYELQVHKDFNSKNFKEYLLVQTAPIPNFKSIILIKPHQNSLARFFGNSNSLTKIEIDTQGLFDIYADNPQKALNALTSEFLSRLIFFGKNMKTPITFLIMPKGALFFKKGNNAYWCSFFAFSSSQKQVLKECRKIEDFIGLLDLINLLEKK